MIKGLKVYIFLAYLSVFHLLTACEGEMEKPQVAAVAFLSSVYVEQNYKKALKFTTGRLRYRMEKIPNLRTFQITVMGLQLDTAKKVVYVDSTMDFFQLKETNVKIIYMIEGVRRGKRFVDHVTMHMDYIDGEWKVAEIIPDKFNINL